MSHLIDLTGKRFGKLEVIKRVKNRNGRPAWLCKCDCGNVIVALGDNLKRKVKTIKSCGCQCKSILKKNRKDTTVIHQKGERFGSLTVLEKSKKSPYGQPMWICRCDCGNIVSVRGVSLRAGKTISCGCSHQKKIKPGEKYGFLVVLGFEKVEKGVTWYRCKCTSCGKEKVIRRSSLKKGQKSCGCRTGNNFRRMLPDNAYKLSPQKRRSTYLTNNYIKSLIYQQSGIKSRNITDDLVKLKRSVILYKREIKKIKEIGNEFFGN